ncbi:MAG: hypothetical protein HC936_06025 [Leptolyngbyaceae cyanobacterium SU_3_3]|nr:hypothetical protein [Leptolyngbyaceae cyanobacterium SU_3_3]
MIEFLGGRFGISGGVLQGKAKVENGLVEFLAGDGDDATQRGGVGQGENQFEAIVQN